MKGLYEKFKRISLSKRIGFSMILILTLSMILITMSECIQLSQIKYYESQLPGQFFQEYSQYSLMSLADGVKKMILSVFDYRVEYLNTIKELLIKNNTFINKNANYSQNTIQPNKLSCNLTKSDSSIFNCNMDIETIGQVEQQWALQKRHPVKRFNIIYQNKQDATDVMVRTIFPQYNRSNNAVFSIKNYTEQANIIKNLNVGEVIFTQFQVDYHGNANTPICFIRTKLQFAKYYILLQLQTYANFLSVSLKRILYSDSANIVLLFKNTLTPVGYQYYASFKSLEPRINYTQLLKPGFYNYKLSNGSLFQAFSLPFSNAYHLGTKSFLSQTNLNQNFAIIIHSISISEGLQNKFFNFVNQINVKSERFITVSFVLIFILIIVIAMLVNKKINNVLKLAKQSIVNYLRYQSAYKQINTKQYSQKSQLNKLVQEIKNFAIQKQQNMLIPRTQYGKRQQKFQKYSIIIKNLIESNARQDFFHQILRKIYMLIIYIQNKKQKVKKLKYHHVSDELPLNMFNSKFMQSIGFRDQQKAAQLINKVRRNATIKLTKKYSQSEQSI